MNSPAATRNRVDADALIDVLVAWMAQEAPLPAEVLHLDGKVVKND